MSAKITTENGIEVPIETCTCGKPMAYQKTNRLGFLVWACYPCKRRLSVHESRL